MNNTEAILISWGMIPDDSLSHHGILGQKWGVRRYQNKDGSLTPAGQKRAAKLQKKYEKITGKKISTSNDDSESSTPKPKAIKDMTDDEIRARINRIKIENELKSLIPEKKSKAFKDFIVNDILLATGKDVSKSLAKNFGENMVKKLTKDDKASELETLNNQNTLLTARKTNKELKYFFDSDGKRALKDEVDEMKLKKTKAEFEKYFAKEREAKEARQNEEYRKMAEEYLKRLQNNTLLLGL